MAQKNEEVDLADTATALAAAVTSSIISKTIVAPLSRVSILLQSNYELIRQGRMQQPYRGAMDCFARIKDQEGILSYWRGNSIHMPMGFISTTLQFATKDKYATMLRKYSNPKDKPIKTLIMNIMAGSFAGATSLLTLYPFQHGFVKRAADVLSPETGMTRQYKGITDIWKNIVRVDGVRGLYKGLGLALAGVIVYRGLYFGLYDSLKGFVRTRDSMLLAFGLGWAVTLTAGAASYPISLVQKRLMITTGLGVKYNSAWHTTKEIAKKEGFRGFYRGYVFSVVQAIGGAGILAAYDVISAALNE